MESYAKLFSVSFQHSYFENGNCRGLRIEPTRATAYLMANLGLQMKTDGHSLLVIGLQDEGAHSQWDGPLRFLVLFGDSEFIAYTKLSLTDVPNEFLYLTNTAPAERDGAWYLHQAQYVGSEKPYTASTLRQELAATEGPLAQSGFGGFSKPDLVLDINLNKVRKGQGYRVAFAAAERVWKYILGPQLSGLEAPQIKCSARTGGQPLEASYSFSGPELVPLREGSIAPVFTSNTAIPFQERPPHKFSLISGVKTSAGAGKTIIDSLPLPKASRQSAGIAQGAAPHSEIFIY